MTSPDPESVETDPALATTSGLPPDFFEPNSIPASDRTVGTIVPGDATLPPRRIAATPAPQVVIDRRASFPVVFVVLAGNMLFFLGGGLAGWTLARKGVPSAE